jgi:hypothetical protein
MIRGKPIAPSNVESSGAPTALDVEDMPEHERRLPAQLRSTNAMPRWKSRTELQRVDGV